MKQPTGEMPDNPAFAAAPLPVHLKDQVLASARALPSPVRAQHKRRVAVAYSVVFAAMVAVFLWAGGVDHGAGRPLPHTWALTCGAALLAAGAMAIAFGRGKSSVGRQTAVLGLAALLTPVAAFLWHAAFANTYTEPFARVGWRCLGLTLVLAALVLGAGFFLRRRTIAVAPTWSGAAFGAAAGASAGVFVDIWCPLANVPHVLVGHTLPLVILVAVGAALGRLLLGVRRLRLEKAA